MEPLHIIAVTVLGLAFVGHVTCLIRYYWVTLGLTAAAFAYFSATISMDMATLPYWVAAAVAVVSAVVIASIRRARRPHRTARRRRSAKKHVGRRIVIDGTNVMYWDDETAQIDTLRRVVGYLTAREITPIVFLDASSRHHLKDPTLNERTFARALGVTQKQVMVCPAGTEADVFILKFARREGLPILSNDRFGDRSKLAKGIKIVKGVMANGRPILDGL